MRTNRSQLDYDQTLIATFKLADRRLRNAKEAVERRFDLIDFSKRKMAIVVVLRTGN